MTSIHACVGVTSCIAVLAAGAPAGAQSEQARTIQQAVIGEASQRTPEVSTDEMRRILAEGSATVFDARPFPEYAVSHIPGARNVAARPGVPMSMYVSDVAEIGRLLNGEKATPIVLYCNGPFCGKSKRLAEELLGAGFTNVRRYQLGIPVWRALGGVCEIDPAGLRRTSSPRIAPPSSWTRGRPRSSGVERYRMRATSHAVW